ncbi:MAG: type II toxin-antitoxin system VapC family toxin [Candidatus Anammoxibacter sp.]
MANFKEKIYIETSIISFLNAKPSGNLLAAARQNLTIDRWEKRKHIFDLYTSELVLEEAGNGDIEAARKRLKSLEGIPLLAVTDSAINLAKKLLEKGTIPAKATDDALHVALSSVPNINYLLTWNCRHIDNAETKPIIRSVILVNGYFYPEICTPHELMGDELNEE